MHQRAPQFRVLEHRAYRSFAEALAALWETDSPTQSIGLCQSRPWPRHHRPVPGVLASLLWHLAVILWLIRWPFASLFHSRAMSSEGSHAEQIVYILRGQNLLDYLPLINAQGVHGQPGKGSQPPGLSGNSFDSDLTVQSDPPQPDNTRQTIVQISSPPRLRIPKELQLPNALIGAAAPPPPPSEVEPKAAPRTSGGTIAASSNTSISNPAATTASALVPPAAPVPDPALSLSRSTTLTAQPAPPTVKGEIADLGLPGWTGAAQLLSLSVDPAAAADSLTVPPGNRFGAFSISPSDGKNGSPGHVANADARDRSGDRAAEDSSTGLGSADPSSAGRGGVRVAEGVSIVGSAGSILPSSASSLVYPVSPPHPHRPTVVVTTGPTGGGGLHLYGVLKGDKIYTIYLPMPGRSWVLQFCEHDRPTEASPRPPGLSEGVVIRLDPALVPPSVLEQYDFRRPLSPEPLAGISGMIILNGVIRADGAVGDLKVLHGILDLVDQAALAAFSRWRFSAALRSDKPVAVDILIGIPFISSGT